MNRLSKVMPNVFDQRAYKER